MDQANQEPQSEKKVGRFGSVKVAHFDNGKIIDQLNELPPNKRPKKIVFYGTQHVFSIGSLLTEKDEHHSFPFWNKESPPQVELVRAKPDEQERLFDYIFYINRTLPEGYQFSTQTLGIALLGAIGKRYAEMATKSSTNAGIYFDNAIRALSNSAIRNNLLEGLRFRTLAYACDTAKYTIPFDWDYMTYQCDRILTFLAETVIQTRIQEEVAKRTLTGKLGKNGDILIILGEPFTKDSVKRVTTNEPVLSMFSDKEPIEAILASLIPDSVVEHALKVRGGGALDEKAEIQRLANPEERRLLALTEARQLIDTQVEQSKKYIVSAIIRETLDTIGGYSVLAGSTAVNVIPFLGQIASVAMNATWWVLETVPERMTNGARWKEHRQHAIDIAILLEDAAITEPIKWRIILQTLRAQRAYSGDLSALETHDQADTALLKRLKNESRLSLGKLIGRTTKLIAEEVSDAILVGPLLRDELTRMAELAALVATYNTLARDAGVPASRGYEHIWNYVAETVGKIAAFVEKNGRKIFEGKMKPEDIVKEIKG